MDTADTIRRAAFWFEADLDGFGSLFDFIDEADADSSAKPRTAPTATLPEQFDAVMHIDETHALQPLEHWSRDELDLPETYPTAL